LATNLNAPSLAVTLAYLALGSNVGDREDHLDKARRELRAKGVEIKRATEVVETEPFGVTEQPRFLNQVLEVEWPGDARQLLQTAKAVEQAVGRTETYRWGPREIDVDILLFGDEQAHDPDLEIPHPGLRERDFFRRPLLELRPDLAPILEP
jgi:2-amino-4-hydroxy-6-hydroxymethyldihydropteridine diphosphokinase